MIYAVLQMLSFVAGHALVKYNFGHYHPFHVVLMMFSFSLMLICLYVAWRPGVIGTIKTLGSYRVSILSFLILNFFNASSFFAAIYLIGLSGYAIMSNLTPVMMIVSGCLFFREKLTVPQTALIAVTIVAAFLFSLGGSGLETDLLGILACLIVSVTWSGMNIAAKKFSEKVGGFELIVLRIPFMAAGFWISFAVLYSLGLVPAISYAFTVTGLLLLLLASVFLSIIPYILFPIALRHTDLTVMGMIKAMQPAIAFMVGITVFAEPSDMFRISAAFIAILGGIVYSGHNYFTRKPVIPPR